MLTKLVSRLWTSISICDQKCQVGIDIHAMELSSLFENIIAPQASRPQMRIADREDEGLGHCRQNGPSQGGKKKFVYKWRDPAPQQTLEDEARRAPGLDVRIKARATDAMVAPWCQMKMPSSTSCKLKNPISEYQSRDSWHSR
jgi:hypothetical protein